MDNAENFSPEQEAILMNFVTNVDKPLFVLRNLPEVLKGALFSRYSRSSLGLRSLLLKEFILCDQGGFSTIAPEDAAEKEELVAVQKAQNFYDRILDGYGDDSIAELGGAHLAVEKVSMLATKVIEDCRIGGSPLEKSTRYIYFDQKVHGEYQYLREPVLMTSAFRNLYTSTCDFLFDTYSKLIPPLTDMMQEMNPIGEGVSKAAYTSSIRAKVLDCLRGLLPASSLTNLGLFANGRFYETLLQRLGMHPFSELQSIGKMAFEELSKVIPSFIRRADPSHKHFRAQMQFTESTQSELRDFAKRFEPEALQKSNTHMSVDLVDFDQDAPWKVAAALLFPHSTQSLQELKQSVATLSEEELSRLFDSASVHRTNRRHKSPRALEHATFTFEIKADFGAYRDLHRHRTLTQERQLLNCDLGFYVPKEICDTPMEAPYLEAIYKGKEAFDQIRKEFPEEAQYVVPMAYQIRWYFHVNLRALQWITELRSSPAGHPTYRLVAQEMARKVIQVFPLFEKFLRFVDYEGYELGRLGQEIRNAAKTEARSSS